MSAITTAEPGGMANSLITGGTTGPPAHQSDALIKHSNGFAASTAASIAAACSDPLPGEYDSR